MLGPEPAWPLGQGHAQKKGKDLGFLLGSGHRKSPGSCSGGTSRFPQLLLLGECSPFLWECFLLLWECFLLLLGTAGGQASVFYPSQSHGTIPTRPRARHSTSPGTEAPRLKCYKNSVRVQGSIAHLSCSPLTPSQSTLVLLVQLCSFSHRGFLHPAWPCSIPLRKALDIWVVFPFKSEFSKE